VHVTRHSSSICGLLLSSGGDVTRDEGHRGRANPREWEEPTPRSIGPDDARLAARNEAPPRGGPSVTGQKRKEVHASVPARKRGLGLECPHVVVVLQKSVGGGWSRIRSRGSPRKRVAASERGPSSVRWSVVTHRTTDRAKGRAHVGQGREDGRGPAKTQGGVRAPFRGRPPPERA